MHAYTRDAETCRLPAVAPRRRHRTGRRASDPPVSLRAVAARTLCARDTVARLVCMHVCMYVCMCERDMERLDGQDQ